MICEVRFGCCWWVVAVQMGVYFGGLLRNVMVVVCGIHHHMGMIVGFTKFDVSHPPPHIIYVIKNDQVL